MQFLSILKSCCDDHTRPDTYQQPSTRPTTQARHVHSTTSTPTPTINHHFLPSISSTLSLRTLFTLDTHTNNHKHPPRTLTPSPLLTQMSLLDHTLTYDPTSLQTFATHKDFTGENIAFLTHLVSWKQTWSFLSRCTHHPPSPRRRQFNTALRIYAAFISMHTAEFPVNLPGRVLAALERTFDAAAAVMFGADRVAAARGEVPFVVREDMIVRVDDVCRDDGVWYWGPIPRGFDEGVFDEAEAEVRYLVLTNTWPRFVSEVEGARCRRGVGVGVGLGVLRRMRRCFTTVEVR